ncbi:hypothetical protein RA263_28805, partial [Pseudomonas syringae pv. tagetis]|uniref:hypothetical protein n=1 Tax=Pseudomonas syringae group genomosp. 7 TaxID=251699 RepID=UPI00376F9828
FALSRERLMFIRVRDDWAVMGLRCEAVEPGCPKSETPVPGIAEWLLQLPVLIVFLSTVNSALFKKLKI